MNRIDQMDCEMFIAKLRSAAELIEVHSVVDVCSDPKDNFFHTDRRCCLKWLKMPGRVYSKFISVTAMLAMATKAL
ncbi:MAG: hypothetical protein FWG73_05440 [Planctomycetaceae bacterium]|nr:hypothetical protein [Planctomycetaceae bacterium]